MPDTQWPLNEAKNRFSSVVEAAQKGIPQTVTKHGIPAVVVISAEEYKKFHQFQSMQLLEFNDHLLTMPTDDNNFERSYITLRDVEL